MRRTNCLSTYVRKIGKNHDNTYSLLLLLINTQNVVKNGNLIAPRMKTRFLINNHNCQSFDKKIKSKLNEKHQNVKSSFKKIAALTQVNLSLMTYSSLTSHFLHKISQKRGQRTTPSNVKVKRASFRLHKHLIEHKRKFKRRTIPLQPSLYDLVGSNFHCVKSVS